MRSRIGAESRRFNSILRLELLERRDAPAALTPAQVRHSYGFDQIQFATATGTVAGDGRGTTIAIVDAFNDPYVSGDLDAFDRRYSINGGQSLYSQYGAASSILTVATPQGAPRNNAGWAAEIALDVEWAHAIAPGAKILLVEAKSTSFTDLMGAVNYARSQPGVVAVSMSWGSNEFSGETSASFENVFTTPPGHAGVTFVGASGDNGAPGIWPAVSPHVLSVGGTRLSADAAGNYVTETGWTSGGGGPSAFFGRPAFQAGVYSGTRRGSPDVAYDGDPATGFSVYNTYDRGWEQIGGTSAGAPQWAAIVAIADQGRALHGLGSLDGATQTLPMVYTLSSADFHDVTGGANGYSAAAGYDLITGRGSPRANLVIRDLVGSTTQTGTIVTTAGNAASPAVVVGPRSVTWTIVVGQTDAPAMKTGTDVTAPATPAPAEASASQSGTDDLVERLRREESERASLLAWLPPVDLSPADEWLSGDGAMSACDHGWFADNVGDEIANQ
jgi:subtilase family serine protease